MKAINPKNQPALKAGERSPPHTSHAPSYIHPIRVTPVFDSYWRFAAERQSVFRQRLEGQPAPWTSDPVIGTHKFTNAYRASDRVSQFLIKNVIYRQDLPDSPPEVIFRILLFKLFNKIETWKLLEHTLGEITYKNYNFDHYDTILSQAMSAGGRIYSAAYIMPSSGSVFGHPAKHQNHLRLLEYMMKDGIAGKLSKQKKMQGAFELLKSYPSIGNFLAYQFVTDINYSEVTDFSEMDFVVPGPGALDGIRKCFTDKANLNEAQLIRLMADNQEQEFERLGIKFQSLWGRRLQLIDCQNLFCEVDKYARVAHPDVAGISGRTRIKQKFAPTGALEIPWYPPKWGINSKIAADLLVTPAAQNTSPSQAKLNLGN
ncbi:nucleotide kinase domain-containing protein [Pseudomonas aeruginosa]|uniref:nucleotide kinase domain-containing protein n=1 Tax=Pseudomonas aeruginosa TaxID=287 RepID=UPI000691B973|nr:nucleotide kinase domain-containing protein [Pseudomonas aeruginosa]KXE89619.1 hypothetical protein AW934_02700 [Pseudomonas aeruginosa]KXE94159.1 hypothetical protein AW932_02565 [Pseudomonas aeruginosa]KXE98289.1 hypothetical protein AW933_03720 [Pseudomonas aeruginosa]KXF08666.1 hypothetical protein AW935_02685 [Pseudomonas aeruginosa]KXF13790.1 hypothetical protein AW936_02555 [Pseudomonas aeruginosa]